MNNIHLIKQFELNPPGDLAKDLQVSELFKGAFRRLVEVQLQNNAVLARHKADVPITVFCVSGKGTFVAGPDLEDSQELRPGTLITLEAGVEHEVRSDPSLNLIVTKFQNS